MAFEFAGKSWKNPASFLYEYLKTVEEHGIVRSPNGTYVDWNRGIDAFIRTHRIPISEKKFFFEFNRHFREGYGEKKLLQQALWNQMLGNFERNNLPPRKTAQKGPPRGKRGKGKQPPFVRR